MVVQVSYTSQQVLQILILVQGIHWLLGKMSRQMKKPIIVSKVKDLFLGFF